MPNVNRQTIYQMGNVVNDVVKQATGRDPVQAIDMDYVTVEQNTLMGIETQSGAMASFITPRSLNLLTTLIDINPMQSGSGDPSSENIREITGWKGANILRTGKNLLDALAGFKYCRDNDWNSSVVSIDETNKTVTFNSAYTGTLYRGIVVNANSSRPANQRPVIPIKENTPYTFIFRATAEAGSFPLNIAISYTDGTNTGTFTTNQQNSDGFIVFTTPSNKTIASIYIGKYSGRTTTFYYEDFGLFEGTVAYADFEPYIGTTYTVSWETEAGTVYGGSLDVINGILTVTDAVIASYDGEELPSTWISDRDVYAEGTTPTTGAQVVYKLAEPITYEITPQQITTLAGLNNVWSNTGDISLSYYVYHDLL